MDISEATAIKLKNLVEESSNVRTPSDLEKRVQSWVEKTLVTACDLWETSRQTVKPLSDFYNACWTPYLMLRAPLASWQQLGDSPEKNLEILTEATAENVQYCTVTSRVYRMVPWLSCSQESSLQLSQSIASLATILPLIYLPAYSAVACVWGGSGVKTLDINTISKDVGMCLENASKAYQGPEAIAGLVGKAAVGILIGAASYPLSRLLLADSSQTERYHILNKLYTDVAMLLKQKVDDAVASGDNEEKTKLLQQTKKLQANVALVMTTMQRYGRLTESQVVDIAAKYAWGIKYALDMLG